MNFDQIYKIMANKFIIIIIIIKNELCNKFVKCCICFDKTNTLIQLYNILYLFNESKISEY